MANAALEKPFLTLGKVVETVNRQVPAAEYFRKPPGFLFAAEEKFGRRIETSACEGTIGLVKAVELGDFPGFQQRQGFDASIGQVPEGGRQSPLKTPAAGDRAEVTPSLNFFCQGGDKDKVAVTRKRPESIPIQRLGGQGSGQVDEGEEAEVDMIQTPLSQQPSQIQSQ